jgi:8-oxo-dGTP diphosphatase
MSRVIGDAYQVLSESPLVVVVAAALIDDAGRVLVQQRPADKAHAGLWEFPGGKVERGETPEAALVRELREELDLEVAEAALAPVAFATAGQLVLLLYAVRDWSGNAVAREASALCWATPAEMRGLPMPPADVPLVEALAAAL